MRCRLVTAMVLTYTLFSRLSEFISCLDVNQMPDFVAKQCLCHPSGALDAQYLAQGGRMKVKVAAGSSFFEPVRRYCGKHTVYGLVVKAIDGVFTAIRSEEHTSELQSR